MSDHQDQGHGGGDDSHVAREEATAPAAPVGFAERRRMKQLQRHHQQQQTRTNGHARASRVPRSDSISCVRLHVGFIGMLRIHLHGVDEYVHTWARRGCDVHVALSDVGYHNANGCSLGS